MFRPGRSPSILVLCLLVSPATFGTLTAGASPQPDPIAADVDRLLAEELFTDSTTLAPRCDDATYLRRVWLDLVGDIPAPEQVTAFLLDPAEDKRQRVVLRLLNSPQFGLNWARYWRDVIMNRRIEERSLIVSNPLVADLTIWFNENRPWDEIASEFIRALGDIRDSGATAIIAAQDGRTEEIAAEVSRVFLGIQIQCAQCHDHPWDQWKREQFHELAAFFPRVAVRQVRSPTRRSFEVIANDRRELRRPGKKNNENRRGTAEHRMPDLENPSAPGTRMQPRFFLTTQELPFGSVDADRRAQLAQWMVRNEWFATALVNRMWAELVGEGFYDPVDDLGPDRQAHAPQAVALLSGAFAESGFDLKWLFRTICATEAYQRESRSKRNEGEPPFTASVTQRLRADQLYNSLLSVLETDESSLTSGRNRGNGSRRRAPPRDRFTSVFAFDPSDPRDTVVGSIPQSLAMMNDPQIERGIRSTGSARLLSRLLGEMDNDESLVTELYLRTLCRAPTSGELQTALQFVEGVDRRGVAYEDLFWALLNSAEFLHRR